MKEVKTFFANNNRLNKGYARVATPHQANILFYRKRFQHVLPPIDVMSEYEEMNPGTMAKLMSMAEIEQNHRHSADLVEIENRYRATKRGQNLAVFVLFLLCLITLSIAVKGNVLYAIVFFAISFIPIYVSSFAACKKVNKNHKEQHNRHHKTPYNNHAK